MCVCVCVCVCELSDVLYVDPKPWFEFVVVNMCVRACVPVCLFVLACT